MAIFAALLLSGCAGGKKFEEPPEQSQLESHNQVLGDVAQGAPDKQVGVYQSSAKDGAEGLDPVAISGEKRHPDARDYFRPLTDYDKANIRYIINTLANNSTLALWSYQDSLERVGARTEGLHPLRYLGFVFSDPELKGQINSIGWTPWSRFVSRFSESLDSAAKRDNLTEAIILDFAKTVGLELSEIRPLIDGHQWAALFDALLAHVA